MSTHQVVEVTENVDAEERGSDRQARQEAILVVNCL